MIMACAECGCMVRNEHRAGCVVGQALELDALRRFFAHMERRAGVPGGELPHLFLEAARAAGLVRADADYTGPYVYGTHHATWPGAVALAFGRAALLRGSRETGDTA